MKWGEKSGLPLVPCPKCGEEVLELVAGPGSKVPGAVFFACRFHDRDVSSWLSSCFIAVIFKLALVKCNVVPNSILQDPSSCPWFLFADKYKGMLIRRGLIEATAAETVIQQPEPELAAVGRDSDVPMLGAIGGLDAKLKKLVTIGQIGVVCTLVIAVFVVLGVIILLVNRK
jgi:hypothetical protein